LKSLIKEKEKKFIIYGVAFCSHFISAITMTFLSLYGQSLGASNVEIGLLFASFLLAALISAPLWGILYDHIGGKKPIVFGMIGTTLGCFLMILVKNISLLIGVEFLCGIFFAGNRPLINEMVVEFSSGKKGKEIGLLNTNREFAFMAGCLLAGLMGEINLIYNFYIGLVVAIVGLFLSFFIKESREKTKKNKKKILHSSNFGSFVINFRYLIHSTLFFLCIAIIISQISRSGVGAFLPVYLVELNFSKSMIGIMYALESSIEIVLYPLIGKVCDKFINGPRFLIILNFIASAFVFFLYSISYMPIHFIIAQFFAAISWASCIVGITVFTARVSPYKKRGEAMGIVESSYNIGGLGGPIIVSLFSKIYDFRTILQIIMIFPVLSAIISLLRLKKLKTSLTTERRKR